jgi:anaerobic selenocysteine-containing dehydrogenase
VKPESEIYRLLAARLGIAQAEIDAAIPAEVAIERWLDARLQASVPGITLEALREGPVRVASSGDIAFADLQFPTPSGRIEIWSDEAAARWTTDPLPGFVEPVESTRERRTPRFPLNLLTPNTKHRIHSQFGNLATMRAIEPHPVIAISPADARSRQIAGGERVRVFNERTLTVACRIDEGSRMRVAAQRLVADRRRCRERASAPARPTWASAAAFQRTPCRWNAHDGRPRPPAVRERPRDVWGATRARWRAPTRTSSPRRRRRHVVTVNEARRPGLPTFHLSLACNHCRDAPCIPARRWRSHVMRRRARC